MRYIHRWQKHIEEKNYEELKTYSSEEIENLVVEGERDNDEDDEYLYYLLMERAHARSR